MKTTIELPDELLIAAKKRAAELRTTLKELFERGLRRELADRAEAGPTTPARIDWVSAPGGLPEGLDVADREQLHRRVHRRR